MISRSLLAPSLFGVAALMALSSCAPAGPFTVAMQYRPTSVLDVGKTGGAVPAGGGKKLFIAPVTDHREDKVAVGVNREDDDEQGAIPILPGSDPAVFVREALVKEFRGAGLNIVEDQPQAEQVLSLDLLQFWCIETSTYNTQVRASVKLTDASGKVLWEGQAGGFNKRFGRSLKAENYQETFSDSMVDLVERLLATPEFRAGLK